MERAYGQLFIEAAPILEVHETYNTYDWENHKISYKIDTICLDLLLNFLTDKINFTEIKNEKSFAGRCIENDILKLFLMHDSLNLSLELNSSSALGLKLLLIKAKERIYGW